MADIPRFVTPGNPPVRATLDVEALDAIAAGLARVRRRVPPSEEQGPHTPRSLRLIATSGYDVWLITWPPGTGIGAHDHTQSLSVIRVVSGQIADVVAGTQRAAGPGDLIVTPAHTPHEMRTVGPEEATTLHVYSPPLTAVTYHSGHKEAPATAGEEEHHAPTPTVVRPRQAEATARALHPAFG